ncbi:uncharacterized protein LY89DRAFT_696371 [Mollisia scopiformis]|uniref:F-box domain-containing protein n=1 Tax=Mollisia scopiformis TaxID=149040 RepID=A0A194XFV9_MOLSC|nr:uncharacterized protein LY89DRAFT_696371 [Mollisia scopiformis]KUJ19014.1 hypothetical protein LY89DRAFT_696371 [Mollisia scopiformis]
MIDRTSRGIGSLPNEILISILSLFPTRTLLPMATTSRRIHNVILSIIHRRLLAAASVADRQLILECYHPSAKFSTPYYNCEYLGTDALDGESCGIEKETCSDLGRLRGLYSHFRPAQPEGDRKIWTPRPTGGWLQATLDQVTSQKEGLVCQNVDLESYELFCQLQSVVNIVKPGPNGYFSSSTKISEGLMRVWRDWLAERSQSPLSTTSTSSESREEQKKRLLWSSVKEDIGLRLRVVERTDLRPPLLRGRDEDPNVGYTLQYEELVVRTSQLLLKLEAALERERSHEGKAIVIVS